MRELSLILCMGAVGALAMVGCGGNVVLESGSGGGATGGAGGSITTTSSICGGPIATKNSVAVRDPSGEWTYVFLNMDYPGDCIFPQGFPDDCSDASVFTVILTPGSTVGTYPQDGSSSTVFGAQDKQKSTPDAGCELVEEGLTGTVVITALDDAHVAGSICDPLVSGSFDVPLCASCLGTGADCSNDSQCCNNFCDPTYHVCQP